MSEPGVVWVELELNVQYFLQQSNIPGFQENNNILFSNGLNVNIKQRKNDTRNSKYLVKEHECVPECHSVVLGFNFT